MYREIGEFVKNVGFDIRLYKDGEFWTSVLVALGAGVWIHYDQSWINTIRAHFGDLLSVTSIVFGFVLTTLFFYIQAAGTWSKDKNVSDVAEALVDHHVWTVVSLLALIAYIIFLWAFGKPAYWNHYALTATYSMLIFLCCYCGLQILNQVLTVRWAFKKRRRLLAPDTDDEKTEFKCNFKDTDEAS